jgi:hypothetical protein
MEWMGNTFTHYNYTTTDISRTEHATSREIRSVRSGFHLLTDNTASGIELPGESPFADWKEARRYAGPLPFTFTYEPATGNVLIIEGVRTNWSPMPVRVLSYDFAFLRSLNLREPVLANAFVIRNIPYYWKKGKVDQWK